ncbi:MAG: glycoside hydrolase family 26 protein [Planctomycetota bacterium]
MRGLPIAVAAIIGSQLCRAATSDTAGERQPRGPEREGDASLASRPHMDGPTQELFDRIRSVRGRILGLGRLGPDRTASEKSTVEGGRVTLGNTPVYYPAALAWWKSTYGAGRPAWLEFELSIQWGFERLPSAGAHRRRVFELARRFSDEGGIAMLRGHEDNFAVARARGKKTPKGKAVGSVYDTSVGIEGVLEGGKGRKAFLDYYAQLAREFKAFGRPCVFRPFHEMTGGWFWWGGQPDNYVKLWREAFGIFRKQGARNVIWCWCISAGKNAEAHRYYPGDEFVDILALDDYFVTPALPPESQKVLEKLHSMGGERPIVFGEIGPFASASFYAGLAKDLDRYPRLKGLTLWWGRGWNGWKSKGAGAGSLVDSASPPDVMKAFRGFLEDPRTITLARFARTR